MLQPETHADRPICQPSHDASISPEPLGTLCIDLDGTLVLSDTLVEGVLALVTDRRLFRALAGLAKGRASFKQDVAAMASINPVTLPYSQPLLDYIRRQRILGRKIVLVTAADQRVARAVADHLCLFDEVMASNGKVNLKGETKAAALVARFGKGGFTYAGDSRADLPVWAVAGSAIPVTNDTNLIAAVRNIVAIEKVFRAADNRITASFEALRVYQWVKNILVFVPILTAGAVTAVGDWVQGASAAIAFSATASGIYLINDLLDLDADRRHPRKRNRPFARGALSPVVGIWMAVLLVTGGAAIAGAIGMLASLTLYAVCSIAYSLFIKSFPLVDVFLLALLYTMRIVGGGEATGHRVSLWLLAFSSLFFLSLALIKRVAELLEVKNDGASRRGYFAQDVLILQTMGCCATFSSAVVLALFVQSGNAVTNYASPHLLWGVVPLILFWQCRLWLSTARGWMHDDPIIFAARDWVSWIIAGLIVAVQIIARTITLPVWLAG